MTFNVLGVCTGTHDSAAALIKDGLLVGLVEEERLNGEKHTRAYPTESIDWLLREAGLSQDEITHVAYNFAPLRYLAALPAAWGHVLRSETRDRALPRAASFFSVYRKAHNRVRDLQSRFPKARVSGVPHHLTHGLYAMGAAGYDETAILIVDSLGETATTSIAHAKRSADQLSYRTLHTTADPASLGYAYGAVTQHLGWRRGDEEGTVMALAALGDPARFRPLLARAIQITDDGFRLDSRLLTLRVLSSRWPRVSERFAAATCPARKPDDEVQQVHADLAAALQERTEEVMVNLADRARRLTGAKRLCVGGGVAMNCVSIGKIMEEAGFEEVSVPPAPGDSGTAAGAALAVHLARTGNLADGVAGRCYLGPSYDDVELPENPRPRLLARKLADPAVFLARQLAQGAIVGVFNGPLEAGPRALGNRSILASPLQDDVVARLNDTVKFREPFRPFAPVVLSQG